MTITVASGLIVAAFWGLFWAIFLQGTGIGRYLAARRAWLTVVIGVGVDLMILWFLIPPGPWVLVAGVIAVSGIGLILRSLWNEWRDHNAAMAAAEHRRDEP
jgi:hypothetical protein